MIRTSFVTPCRRRYTAPYSVLLVVSMLAECNRCRATKSCGSWASSCAVAQRTKWLIDAGLTNSRINPPMVSSTPSRALSTRPTWTARSRRVEGRGAVAGPAWSVVIGRGPACPGARGLPVDDVAGDVGVLVEVVAGADAVVAVG